MPGQVLVVVEAAEVDKLLETALSQALRQQGHLRLVVSGTHVAGHMSEPPHNCMACCLAAHVGGAYLQHPLPHTQAPAPGGSCCT